MTPNHKLWSDKPFERLEAARMLSTAEQKALLDTLVEASPAMPKWPFGMPTSINPYVVILGVSPGARGDDNECSPYDPPTIGEPHHCFGGEFTKPGEKWENAAAIRYWQKVRELCVQILQSINPTLKPSDCIAISGHLNLGTAQEGTAGEHALNPKIVEWIPDVIVNSLRPRVLVLFGLKGLLATSKIIQDAFRKNAALAKVVDGKPEIVPFKFQTKSEYRFRIWEVEKPDGGKMSIVLWPNHPSRVPFRNGEAWQEAIKQFISILKMSIC